MPNLAVFSTSVEVFPETRPTLSFIRSLLHVRGGVSDGGMEPLNCARSSPRPWRCFHARQFAEGEIEVFSTSVEVFLKGAVLANTVYKSSPRPWRCFSERVDLSFSNFVFSTSVEVFLVTLCVYCRSAFRLLHVRGGVSGSMVGDTGQFSSSPRPWRCFFQKPTQGRE